MTTQALSEEATVVRYFLSRQTDAVTSAHIAERMAMPIGHVEQALTEILNLCDDVIETASGRVRML